MDSTLDFAKLLLALSNPDDAVCLINFMESNYIQEDFKYQGLQNCSKEEQVKKITALLDEYLKAWIGRTWNELLSYVQANPILVVLKTIYDNLQPWLNYSDDEDKQRFYKTNYDLMIEKIIKSYSVDYLTLTVITSAIQINILTRQQEMARGTNEDTSGIRYLCITVHKSKGLEYGTVILPYTGQAIDNLKKANTDVSYADSKLSYSIKVSENKKDTNSNYDSQEEISQRICEEARILYVAMTRDEGCGQAYQYELESFLGGVSMAFSIYTYSNPYEIDKELYWDSIKNCPHFCVSQTMANGIMGTYRDMSAGKVSTVENLVKGLFSYWESAECKIKQYTDIDNAIGQLELDSRDEKIRQALRFNRKDLSNSLRILFELDMNLNEMQTELMSEEQRYLLMIYSAILNSDMRQDFQLKRVFTESEIDEAIKQGMQLEGEDVDLSGISCDTIVIHGVHQFSPMILQALEHVAKYKRVVLLFNYQNQYKNVYQTWIDVYSSFDLPIKSQFVNEFKPNPLLANSYDGNRLADRMAHLIEGKSLDDDTDAPFEIIEFDNNTEFASYVSKVYEAALIRQEKDKEGKRSTLYYMPEQFYAANNSVNNILKVYYPGQFGERHFLTYPIGHFFLSITNMWDPDEGGIHIENMNDIVECLNSGIINVKSSVKLSTVFNRTKEFFIRAETLEQIIDLLGKLKKRIQKAEEDPSEREECRRLIYYGVSEESIDTLSEALKQLDQIARLFYEDFEDRDNNFKEFYKKIRDFLENRVLEAEDLEDDFWDVVQRVLLRLVEVDEIEASGTFDVLKETMSYYLNLEGQ